MDRNDAMTTARALRAWAEAAGVFSQGRSAGIGIARVGEAATMFGAGAEVTFTAKPITAIGVSAPPDRDPKLVIYTRRRLTKAEQATLIEQNRLGLPVEFQVALPFGVSTPTTSARFDTMFRNGRMTCGSSISVGNAREAGTLGALLRDGDGKLYGLSCNHVTGGCSNARTGVPIVAPGILDVGSGAPDVRTVGHHHRSLSFVQGDPSAIPDYRLNLDAAIFAIADGDAVSSWQGDAYDTPALVADPLEDAAVEKVGRTTGHTSGVIESELVGALRVDYNVTVFHSAEENNVFRGTVYFEPVYVLRGADNFAFDGDSGALVVRRNPIGDEVAAVGLVIGGGGNGETYMLPIRPILDRLGMSLVTGHG